MMRQYLDIKAHYPNYLVFYQMGDFYELFYKDAEIASKLLNIVQTRRGESNGKPVSMAGVPIHSYEKHLKELIKQGQSVVICDQVMGGTSVNLDKKKKLISRQVTRIITPGTVSDEVLLEPHQNSLLVSICEEKGEFGIAILEIASGQFQGLELNSPEKVLSELKRLMPAEILLSKDYTEDFYRKQFSCVRYLDPWQFDLKFGIRLIKEQFKLHSLDALNYDKHPLILKAAGSLLNYAYNTQKSTLPHLEYLKILHASEFVFLDAATQSHLELSYSTNHNNKKTVMGVLDTTATSMGSRLLKRWLTHPLQNITVIQGRQQAIQALLKKTENKYASYHTQNFIYIHNLLQKIGDMERVLGRIGLKTARPNDLLRLRQALEVLPSLKDVLKAFVQNVSFLEKIYEAIQPCSKLLEILSNALSDELPILIKEGGVFARGYNENLDTLRQFSNDANSYLKSLEIRERERTGFSKLKVGFNHTRGYYIEITNAELKSNKNGIVPKDYESRQTLLQAERFTTSELKKFEIKALSAREKALMLEKELYESLLQDITTTFLKPLQETSKACSTLDVLSCLAERAVKLDLTCPTLLDTPGIEIEAGRHLVVEHFSENPFIANDTYLHTERRMLVVTGPNMGGKSTYMRQIALIVLLTMIGSYVPAKKAAIKPVDGIFTRIGAGDDLMGGRSTFMVEMMETAYILHHATENSLILIDEMGRGTSAFDGLALAFACAEYLVTTVKAYTLFSTHYFELTSLEHLKGVSNIHLEVDASEDHLTFLYLVKEGPANQSYGIKVAGLSGIPSSIIHRANEKLKELNRREK